VPNKQNVVKYVFGRGRLIEGLEMAFQKCKKGEVFQVKVSPEYAYDDREDIPSIPPNSSIVFDVTVLDIQKHDP
jgi:FKBP-type peptidyl-prolyl cis-trans isomerase